jgi:DNA repair protein RecN (Recombination protein N)
LFLNLHLLIFQKSQIPWESKSNTMIKSLQIKNYAIIEDLQINFADGLTIITGETGAGKSILLGALGLIMGKRADTKSLYDTSRKCVIEGIFNIAPYGLKPFFEVNDIDYEEECVVRRELTPSGKSRAFVNDTPVNLNLLKLLSSSLVDLHQQFDTLDIHNVSFQLRMIDALAGNKELLTEYQNIFRRYTADRRKLRALIEQNSNAEKEIDFINFQLNEFNEAELVDGEQEEMEGELKRLTNAESIKQILSGAHQFLVENDQSLVGQLEQVVQSISEVKAVDKNLTALYNRFQGLVYEIQDVSEEFDKIAEKTEYDAERIQEIQQRLDLIYRLQNKHRVVNVSDLIAIQEDLDSQLKGFGDLTADIEALESTITEMERQLNQMAVSLSKNRQSVIPDFEIKVLKLLAKLSMPHAQLKVDVTHLESLTQTGVDEINFYFSANKGGRMQLIKDAASGGEISRLTLITKSLVASAIPLPTLIFDEIDSGVSGDVALKMGDILRKLSNQHQVVSITHSPQISSKADAHYFVYKRDKEDRTITKVKLLTELERVKAIAVMLSQSPPSEAALENARELLGLSLKTT